MFIYLASFTVIKSFAKIKEPIEAANYSAALDIAQQIAADKGYRFDDLNYKSQDSNSIN